MHVEELEEESEAAALLLEQAEPEIAIALPGEEELHAAQAAAGPPQGVYAVNAERNFRMRWLILLGLIFAAIMEVLDTTIINVALPQMAGNLSSTTQDIAWVSTGYILSNVVVLPMTAFLTSRFGRRRYLLASIILFTASSFFCGISHSLGELVLWRVIQGAAGAALISTAQSTLVEVFPPHEQGIVQPLFMMGLVVAPTVGPALGGWLTDVASWAWCFFVNVPVGLIATALVVIGLHDTEAPSPNGAIDWPGIGLLTLGLATLQYILEEGQRDDWFQSETITRLAIVSGVSLIALIVWQLSPRNRHPVVDVRVLKNPSLSAGIVLFVATGFGLYGVTYLYPLMAQTLHGLTSLQTGLALLPGGLATAVSIVYCASILSKPGSRVDPRGLVFIGIVASVTGMWMLGHLSPASRTGDVFLPLIVRGISIGFLIIPINQSSIASLEKENVVQGVALLGLGRQLGGSFGIALLATFLASQMQSNRANLVPYLTPDRPGFSERLSMMTGAFVAHGYSFADAQHAALGVIDQMLGVQVMARSFNATFLLLLLVSLATAPAVFLLRKPKPGAEPAAMGH